MTATTSRIAAGFVLAVLSLGQTAVAADLGRQPKRVLDPIYEPQTSVHRHFYVRADVGVGRHEFAGFSQAELAGNGGSFLVSSLDDTIYLGAGLGVKVSQRFRFDVTGEYRSSAKVHALDNLTATLVAPPGTLQANTSYTGSLTSYVGMLNGYWDLFTLRGVTPYIGAGVGFAHNRAGPFVTASSATFTDPAGTPTLELTNGSSVASSKTNLAWALMAGASFDLSERSKLDVGYRYLNLGSGVAFATGLLDCVCGTVGSPLMAADLSSHEFRVGLRVALDSPAMNHAQNSLK